MRVYDRDSTVPPGAIVRRAIKALAAFLGALAAFLTG
jgi:hypothetical protein